jgi:hypothetical protein
MPCLVRLAVADACYHPKEEWRKPDRLRTNEYVNEKHGRRNRKSAIRPARALVGGFISQKLHGFVGENAAGDRDRCERAFGASSVMIVRPVNQGVL